MNPLKLIMPHGGYGLGNDLIPWAKAYVLSRELGATALHPAWANNLHGFDYRQYFGTFRWDWQLYRMLVRVLPKYSFDEKTYHDIGENDFVLSCQRFAEIHGLHKKNAYIITITGLWGAFSGLESARHFVLGELYKTRFTRDNLFSIAKHKDPTKISIGIHIRRGNFGQSNSKKYEGVWNTVLSIDWYLQVCRSLFNNIGRDNVEFLIATDGKRADVEPILQEFPCLLISELNNSVCSDLIALSETDLIVCSLSIYSMWAAFLSKSPYIWFKPHLSSVQRGLYMKNMRVLGIFKEPCFNINLSEISRSIPVDMDGILPQHLIDELLQVSNMKQAGTDLIRGGICM
jgi:hypothetical protein